MALIEKLLDLEQPRIRSNHIFQAALSEWARGTIDSTQAKQILAVHNGFSSTALSTADTGEAQAWVNLAPTGTQAGQKADRSLWITKQQDIIALMEIKASGYDTPSACRVKIGLST